VGDKTIMLEIILIFIFIACVIIAGFVGFCAGFNSGTRYARSVPADSQSEPEDD
jgi:hypothetical protein